MRLHQVGASQAEVWPFAATVLRGSGNRLDWVRQRLGLSDKQVSLGLDWCHAVHHVSLALAAVLQGVERQRVFQEIAQMAQGPAAGRRSWMN